MYDKNLELLRVTRDSTLQICSGIGQMQSEFAPAPGKWSVGENLDHLLLAEKLYRGIFTRLIELQKSGQRPVITIGFDQLNTSLPLIPKPLLPMLEIPFTVFNLFVPTGVRNAMTQFRVFPVKNPDMSTPQWGKPIKELLQALALSYEETAALLRANPDLPYRDMRYRHPMMGDNNVLQSLQVIALHEQRHQSQIQEILRSNRFPKVA